MANAKDQAEALAALRSLRIKPGETIYTIVRHVAPSGMSRVIDCYIMRSNKPYWIGGRVAAALGYRYDRNHQGMRVSGCGMDMCFAVVYNLGATLWPKGTRKPHGTRNGEPDSDGGYALEKSGL
jgi:hypothetical protein